jgi:hypothetical protein
MRFEDPSTAGKAGAQAAFANRAKDRDVLRRPDPGTPLYTITVESHIEGCSKRIVVRQATRKNQVVSERFGVSGNPTGWDVIMRVMRKWLICRWIEI